MQILAVWLWSWQNMDLTQFWVQQQKKTVWKPEFFFLEVSPTEPDLKFKLSWKTEILANFEVDHLGLDTAVFYSWLCIGLVKIGSIKLGLKPKLSLFI